MKNILITGSTGFIGQYVLDLFIKNKYKVYCTYVKKNNKRSDKIAWIKTKKLLSDKFKSIKFDTLLDLAWYDLNDFNSKTHIKIQVSEHLNLYKSLIKVNPKISIYAVGSCLEYGREGQLKESYKSNPVTNYAIAKDSLRKKTQMLKKNSFFKFTWMRIFYIYGQNESRRTIYSQFVDSVSKNKKTFEMSKGTQKKDYLPVEKVAEFIFKLTVKNSDFGIVNLCSGKGVKLVDLIYSWKKKFKSKINIKIGVLKMNNHQSMNFFGCNIKLKKILKGFYG